MAAHDQNNKPREVDKRRFAAPFSNATFSDVLIWLGTGTAIVLMVLFVTGGWCLDKTI